MTVAAMADSMRLVHTVSGASTAAFVLEDQLPAGVVPDSWKYWQMSDDAVEGLWRRLIATMPDEQKSPLDPALAFYYLDRGNVAEARRHMSQIEFSEYGRKRLDFLRDSSAWGPRVAAMLEPR